MFNATFMRTRRSNVTTNPSIAGNEQINSSASVQVPKDIWLYIAQFIPPKTLRNLYSLNSLFLDLSLNERYKEVNFLQVTQKTISFLEHIRDTNLSSRVRHLRVNPFWFDLDPPPIKVSLRSTISRTLRFGLGRSVPATSHSGIAVKRKDVDRRTTEVVVHFHNVTTFVLVTRHWSLPRNLPTFLSNAWTAFGTNLRRLTINVPLSGFAALLPSPSLIANLEDLILRFSADLSSDDPTRDTAILTEVVSPFLERVGPSLRVFNLMSSALGDHSVVFRSLEHATNLVTLSLNIGFYSPLLKDPSALTRFIAKNATTLRHVKLQPLQTFRLPSPTGTAYGHFAQWMLENSSNEYVLSNLHTLVVFPSTEMPPILRLDATNLYIPRSGDTLTNLVLAERSMSFSELTQLVSTFAHRPPDRGLKVLNVKLVSLNPQVFDLLAEKLKGLDDLDVKFKFLLPNVQDENTDLVDDQEPTDEVVASFLEEMRKRFYPDWGLYSLRIWQRSRMTPKTARDILLAIQPSIPSLNISYQMDHTHPLYTLFNF